MSAETTARPLQAGDRVLIAEHLVPAFDGQTHGTVVEVAGTRYQYVLVDVAGRVYWFASTDLTLDPTSPSDGAVTSTPAPSDDTNALVELDREEAQRDRTYAYQRVMSAALEWEYADAYPDSPAAMDATKALDALRTAVRDYKAVIAR